MGDVLKHRRFTGFTLADVEEVVKNCQVDMEEITDPDDAHKVIHGTNFKAWNGIQQSGLSRMERNHIHFAAGEPGSEGVISGMRGSAQVYIYIDVHSAMKDGLKFFRSSNNVILSPGNDQGIIPTKYFKQVKNVKTNQLLEFSK